MDDKQVTAGLALLADEAETPQIDTYAVIAAAKTRTRNRRLTAASALGTVAVAGVMVATMGFSGAGHSPATGGPPTASTSQEDVQANKLTQQLAEVRSEVIPEQYTVEESDVGGASPPLTFARQPLGEAEAFFAHASLRDGESKINVQISVAKKAAGSPLEPLYGTPLTLCVEGDQNCTRTQLEDGTLVAVQINTRPPAITLISSITAQRPDGTYLQLILSTDDGNTPIPVTSEQLLKFATVFTY